jgi:hypothetical protein
LIVALGSILRTVTGQGQNQFVPLRPRVQSFINHWFDWRKYDGAKTLAKFNQTLHDEADIDRLTVHLVGVVNETLQPTKVGLWRREPDGEI